MSDELVLTPEQEAVVQEARELQLASRGFDDEPMTDNVFAKALGPKWGGGSKWNLIKNGNYTRMVKNAPQMMEELRRGLNYYKSTARLGERFEGKRFVMMDIFKAVLNAVNECRLKPLSDTRRLIQYLAPSGGGKSLLSNELNLRAAAVVLEAHRGWTKSAFFPLKELCKQFHIDADKLAQATPMENALLDEWRKEPPVLVIDEAEYFGKETLDFFKRGLNQTRVVIVFCGIREAIAKWHTYWRMESDQLRRRTHATFELELLTPDMVAPMFDKVKLADPQASLKAVCDAANDFGSIALADLVANSLHGTAKKEEVTNALNLRLAEMRKIKG